MDFATDIPLALARAAHNGTSHTPDLRGDQEIAEYVATLTRDLNELTRIADTSEKVVQLQTMFVAYRSGYRACFLAMLAAKSRCVSTMIAGSSKFPVRRAQKASDRADRATRELIEFRRRSLEAIRKELQPELRPIMAGDGDAVERLEREIAEAEANQQRMKSANAAIRKHAHAGADAQVTALRELGFGEALAREALVPDPLGNVGFASFQLTNNGANIRRMRKRLEEIRAAKATQNSEEQGTIARLELAPADNRVRVYFPDKPDPATRDRLGAAGFRWTPSRECWQAYINHRSVAVARREAGLDAAPTVGGSGDAGPAAVAS